MGFIMHLALVEGELPDDSSIPQLGGGKGGMEGIFDGLLNGLTNLSSALQRLELSKLFPDLDLPRPQNVLWVKV